MLLRGKGTCVRETMSETAAQNPPKKNMGTELYDHMKTRAWGAPQKNTGWNGTLSSRWGGARSVRSDGQCGCAWFGKLHPALEKVVGWLGRAVGAGKLHGRSRVSMLLPLEMQQIAPRNLQKRLQGHPRWHGSDVNTTD